MVISNNTRTIHHLQIYTTVYTVMSRKIVFTYEGKKINNIEKFKSHIQKESTKPAKELPSFPFPHYIIYF